jgi:hypothetical protein
VHILRSWWLVRESAKAPFAISWRGWESACGGERWKTNATICNKSSSGNSIFLAFQWSKTSLKRARAIEHWYQMWQHPAQSGPVMALLSTLPLFFRRWHQCCVVSAYRMETSVSESHKCLIDPHNRQCGWLRAPVDGFSRVCARRKTVRNDADTGS